MRVPPGLKIGSENIWRDMLSCMRRAVTLLAACCIAMLTLQSIVGIPHSRTADLPQDAAVGEAAGSRTSARQLMQDRQLRIPEGFAVALEPKLFFNLFNSASQGKMRVQTRLEFWYQPPQRAIGRRARDLMERVTVYSTLQQAFSRFGMDGRSCLQRAICETARTPRHCDGLLGDIVTLVLSPSHGLAGPAPPQLADLMEAEWDGQRSDKPTCSAIYHRCPVSLFNFVDRASNYKGALMDLISGADTP